MDSSPSLHPHPSQEPETKKLKMSTTTTSDDEPLTTNPNERKPRYRRRKVAIFFAYCGVGYQGMQKNPGAKTIEGDLEEALYLSGAVPDNDRGKPKSFDFARSARTDKGVSAVGQVVSGRFYVDHPGFIDRLNSNLPDQIRIFGFKRTTASFNAKKFCDRRRYVYLIPVFALNPNSHRDRESVLASLGSENELVKCLECSERGRKVEGVMGRGNVNGIDETKSGVLSESTLEPEKSKLDSVQCSEEENRVNESGVSLESNIKPLDNLKEENVDSNSVKCDDTEDGVSRSGTKICYGEEEKERFNRILNYYVGTHNFHNFTTRIKAVDPSAKRFILSFNANTVVIVDGMDFVKCEVMGQSFMLHQIRKMIGLAVAIMRNCAPESLIETALRQDVSINVPTAPEVGLYLDECFFTSYNQKWKDTHEEISMASYAEEAEDFKMKHVYPHVAAKEHKEGVVGLWLHSLNYRNYSDLRYEKTNGACMNKESEACTNAESALADSMTCTNAETAQVDSVTCSNAETAQVDSVTCSNAETA